MLVQYIATVALLGIWSIIHSVNEAKRRLAYLQSTRLFGMTAMNRTTELPRRAIIGRAEKLKWFETIPGERMALRIHSRDVGGAFTIIEARVPAMSGPPAHLHKYRDEIFEVLEGRFLFQCADDTFAVSPGTTVVVPRGVAHTWANISPSPARLLFSFVPGGIDDLFEEIGKTPPDCWAELSQRHDTWIVGPPLQVDDSPPDEAGLGDTTTSWKSRPIG